jgi:GT2 family glycosyltransferase
LNSDNIKLIEREKLLGVTKDYNDSFNVAKGDYIYIGNDDTVLMPEVFIKSCNLMDKEEQIGLIAPKDQESIHGNLPGVTLKLRQYWALLSRFHIFRISVLKEINYYDKNFRTYYTDDDSCLSVLAKGYTIAFTRDVGMIHYRIPDQDINLARATNQDTTKLEKELKYLENKWKNLTTN